MPAFNIRKACVGYITLLLVVFMSSTLQAFAPPPARALNRVVDHRHRLAASSSVESETERLLRKARELREAAAQAEEQVHDKLTERKQHKDDQSDKIIDDLFFTDSDSALVDRLRNRHCCLETLQGVVARLDVRETKDGDKVQEGFVDQLVEGAAVLDEEFRAAKKGGHVAHAEQEHWGGGQSAKILQAYAQEIRRERSEQFQKRQEELREAQRRKDDHQFQGYQDVDTWNPDDKGGF